MIDSSAFVIVLVLGQRRTRSSKWPPGGDRESFASRARTLASDWLVATRVTILWRVGLLTLGKGPK